MCSSMHCPSSMCMACLWLSMVRLINGSKMIWLAKFDPKLAVQKMARATVFMGVPTLYVRMLAEPDLTKETYQAHAPLHCRLCPFIAGNF
jgi:malonyl-CoA/methylmalonyl-CoA synthetase